MCCCWAPHHTADDSVFLGGGTVVAIVVRPVLLKRMRYDVRSDGRLKRCASRLEPRAYCPAHTTVLLAHIVHPVVAPESWNPGFKRSEVNFVLPAPFALREGDCGVVLRAGRCAAAPSAQYRSEGICFFQRRKKRASTRRLRRCVYLLYHLCVASAPGCRSVASHFVCSFLP